MIKYYCPECSQKLGVPDHYAGRRVRCNKCNHPSVVPAAVLDTPELIDEPAVSSGVGGKPVGGSFFSSAAVSSSRPSPIDAMETGPDPLALAAARAAHERKRVGALLQTGSARNASAFPTFGFGSIPLAARIPLALVTSLVLALGFGLLWAWVALASGWSFGLFCFLSAGAAAWGLTLYTEHRNVGLGVLSVVLGLGAIMFGKYMISRWVILPMLDDHQQTQIAEGGGIHFFSSDELQEVLADEAHMLAIACASLIRSGEMDEMEGRQFIVEQRSRQGERTDLSDAQRTALHEQSAALRDGWDDAQKREAVFRYSQYVFYVYLDASQEGRAIKTGIAFAGAFSFWDLFLIPMALGVAFKTGAGRS